MPDQDAIEAQDVQNALDELNLRIEECEQTHGEDATEIALAIICGDVTFEIIH